MVRSDKNFSDGNSALPFRLLQCAQMGEEVHKEMSVEVFAELVEDEPVAEGQRADELAHHVLGGLGLRLEDPEGECLWNA